ncbi:3D domain-containing protein [Thermoflavimicrobium daqui]|jgi:3D (Asp-Asp-Asp) domain-containing protein|uniref:G5 domain-containing protein n=1 Tax=Thermoflavimicrobium daqui TaxID=2137476 RepID=A0A364K6L9_9BACL|nr:3D domain-containing protein [Thermoflavimicrobium daqui]RAL25928.1 hypothetical protein DL897_07585 [Thermoflavimicrobium daqui]
MSRRIGISLAVTFLLVFVGAFVAIAMEKKVEIAFSDQSGEVEISGYYDTLSEALQSEGYNPAQLKKKYQPNISWEQELHDNAKVFLACNCEVTIKENGKVKEKIKTTQPTVGKLLEAQNIKLTKWDDVYPKPKQKIENGMTITMNKVETKVKKEVKVTPYQVKKVKDSSLPMGTTKVQTVGKEGKEIFQVTTLYKNNQPIKENGKIIEQRKRIEKTDVVHQVIKIGTKKETSKSLSKKVTSSKAGCRTLSAEVTAYTYYLGENITYAGAPVKRGVIAVDPKVIPLHSRIYVPGYGWGTALDTGGRIKGNIIDVFMESKQEALDWGKPNKTIKVCPPK